MYSILFSKINSKGSVIPTAQVELFSGDTINQTTKTIENDLENKNFTLPFELEEVKVAYLNDILIVPVAELITQLNTTVTKNETIVIIDRIGDSLLSISFNNQINETDRRNSFDLINLLLNQPDDLLIDSQVSNSLTK
jgi:hypothetical protein